MIRHRAIAACVVLLATPLVVTAPAVAQFKADTEAPIEITADTMEWLQEEGLAIARGNADAVQGRYRLSGDVLTAHMSEAEGAGFGEIRRIDAEGNVTLSTPDETVRGESGTYDVDKGVAVLVGAVVLTQGDSVMRGERLVMDLVTGRSTLEGVPGSPASAGQPGGGRVRAIFTPSKSNQ